eukprot:s1290_g7.t3
MFDFLAVSAQTSAHSSVHCWAVMAAVDAGVQTNDCPLVSQYPANLLYAQGMLNTTLLQLQQVELQIFQLRNYVQQHLQTKSKKKKSVFGREADTSDALFAAAEVLTNVRNVSETAREAQRREEREEDAAAADPAELLNRQMQRRILPLFVKSLVLGCLLRAASLEWYIILLGVTLLFAGEYWIIEVRANAPRDAPGRAGDDGAQENRLPALRQRLSWLFKVLLVMFLMELKWSWYVVYFLVSVLFLGGMFDSWIEWFNGGGAPATLENQLDALRRNAREAPVPAPAMEQPGQPGPVAAEGESAEAQDELGSGIRVIFCWGAWSHLLSFEAHLVS